jgi:hypothetical protein
MHLSRKPLLIALSRAFTEVQFLTTFFFLRLGIRARSSFSTCSKPPREPCSTQAARFDALLLLPPPSLSRHSSSLKPLLWLLQRALSRHVSSATFHFYQVSSDHSGSVETEFDPGSFNALVPSLLSTGFTSMSSSHMFYRALLTSCAPTRASPCTHTVRLWYPLQEDHRPHLSVLVCLHCKDQRPELNFFLWENWPVLHDP